MGTKFDRRQLTASLLVALALPSSGLADDEVLDIQLVKPPPMRGKKSDRPLWGKPYTQAEIDAAQTALGRKFPPDLVALYRKHRLNEGYDLVHGLKAMRKMLDWPYEGILFDVENNDLWWPEWGPKPGTKVGRARRLKEAIEAAPKLIPLVSHRFIPETPHSAGNPIFSVYQADIIYYGADLDDFINREFIEGPRAPWIRQPHQIPFWSEMVERAQYSTREERDRALGAG